MTVSTELIDSLLADYKKPRIWLWAWLSQATHQKIGRTCIGSRDSWTPWSHAWQSRPLDAIFYRLSNPGYPICLANSNCSLSGLPNPRIPSPGCRVVAELKNRGVQDISIARMDGLKGFPEAIEAGFTSRRLLSSSYIWCVIAWTTLAGSNKRRLLLICIGFIRCLHCWYESNPIGWILSIRQKSEESSIPPMPLSQ